MNKTQRQKWVLPILAACVFLLASCGGGGERGEEDWTKGAQAYLSQRYTGDFQLLDSQGEEGMTVLTYQTRDELELVFEVRCWMDDLDTPWGEVSSDTTAEVCRKFHPVSGPQAHRRGSGGCERIFPG